MATIKKHGPRHKAASPATGMALPDQTFSAVLLKDAIEDRTKQNNTKNRLRKALFQFDKGNLPSNNLITCLLIYRLLACSVLR